MRSRCCEKWMGPSAPDSWQGGLPFKYHVGGKRVVAHLKVDMDTRIQPYYVTEARIRGSEAPDEWVILGNHRDAWVFGGVDPSSGTAAMLEMTRSLGQLLARGIRPKRTLVICSWDGEEYALTGSTEWGEQYADELKQKAVAYLNVDEATSGKDFEGDAVGSLAPLLVEVSRALPAPSGKTLYDEWKISRKTELNLTQAVPDAELANTRIGSGSDHTVFLNFLGIPTVGLTFTGPYGVYHSMYDDFFWMNHFGDPGYRYHTLMAQLWGVLALRLANAEMLPYDFDSYGENIRQFVVDLNLANHVSGHIDLAALQQRITRFSSGWARVESGRGAGDFFRAAGCGCGGAGESAIDAGGTQLVQPAGNSGASLVQTFFVRGALYLRASGVAGIDGGCRGGRLESGGGAGEDSGGRAREEYGASEADARRCWSSRLRRAMMRFSWRARFFKQAETE